jgi:two-component system chemotaxis response regulator CheB
MNRKSIPYEAVVIGVSFGGLKALQKILPAINPDFPAPIMVVQHQDPQADDFLASHLDSLSKIRVKMAEEKELATPGVVYLAPANYHLLVEDDHTLSLSVDEKVNYSRPAIDVLFESAADAYGSRLIGIILTGANQDGSLGLKLIKEYGGLTVVQDPRTAQAPSMPEAALAALEVDYVLSLEEIANLINSVKE